MKAARTGSVLLIIVGAVLTVVGVVGMLAASPAQQAAIAEELAAPTATPTLRQSVHAGRDGSAVSTLLPTLIPMPTATLIPATSLPPTFTLAPAATPAPVTPIPWTEEEINALSWVCYSEVRGMGEARIDACWSVLSTVRARYAYANEFGETDVAGTLMRPGQFPIEIHFDYSAPDEELYRAVIQYQWGACGSCSGYLYYDSLAGGPSACVIRSSNGSWIEFHNGWN
jgi:hypothetical protein